MPEKMPPTLEDLERRIALLEMRQKVTAALFAFIAGYVVRAVPVALQREFFGELRKCVNVAAEGPISLALEAEEHAASLIDQIEHTARYRKDGKEPT
jgi:hypothetical protein